ncbi:MoaB/Mog domain-containing protein [Stachybotrys elegans]|uniref:molybdopterin adenylyltransferase n=1 Tax=Stachybotrys elegans TaxID=80388 RepID=A0A8K0SNE6_9HYPO|nr:MoaB/Mog domain-containing protein [Stachybotrys elegans]
MVPLNQALGRVAACDLKSPRSTPEHDTSSMDGFAIDSQSTRDACRARPAIFRVQGTIAAGDDPVQSLAAWTEEMVQGAHEGVEPCVEIMTGGRFPSVGPGALLDACVPAEDVVVIKSEAATEAKGKFKGSGTHIAIAKPLGRNSNRRLKGEDIQEGSRILQVGQIIRASHLLPLLSLGIESVFVRPKPRISVWSTGGELLTDHARTPDMNSTYLCAVSQEFGATAIARGVLEDNVDNIVDTIKTELNESSSDIIITSGGVSVGKFDHIRSALERLGAHILFHGLDIRPGHPVWFALLPSSGTQVAFFGLPGNPGAAAACFRFLVVPYLNELLDTREHMSWTKTCLYLRWCKLQVMANIW